MVHWEQGKNIGKDASSYPLDLFAGLAFHVPRYSHTPMTARTTSYPVHLALIHSPLSRDPSSTPPLLEAASHTAVHNTGGTRRT